MSIFSNNTSNSVEENKNVNVAEGSGQQKPLDQLYDHESSSGADAFHKGGILGGKAEKYIRDSANIEDLPGDDDDELDDDEDAIDLDEELDIETDEIEEDAVELDEDDVELIEEDDDDDLDDDEDIL